ncbi:MAG: FKBP-type peptidyl-prolyl cis-trans isomerase, partial [Mariprofundus sp.]|nr:FKBP-type peptidyl-prolyl cis-trans isomerase [Mariprofundus sp.]
GKAFLLENGKKAGVTTTASGLQYEVLTQGSGDKPVATDKVTVNYKGTLIDGTEFDSSYKRGQPASFPLNRVIAGWTEGVQLMSVGSKFKFVIPADLAYGELGAGKKIGPNSVLVFEVELLGIGDVKPAAPAEPAK